MEIERTCEEVADMLERADRAIVDGETNGMTYEQGIVAAIRWMIGEDDEELLWGDD